LPVRLVTVIVPFYPRVPKAASERILMPLRAPQNSSSPALFPFSGQPDKIINMAKTQADTDRPRQTKSDINRQEQTLSDIGGLHSKDPTQTEELHTLTVRDVAKMFDNAGVPRSERSISRWCQPNTQGEKRFDAFLDEKEGKGKYYITPESVRRVLEEEKAKQSSNQPNIINQPTESQYLANDEEGGGPSMESQNRIADLEKEKFELTAGNKAYEILVAHQQKQISDFTNRVETLARENGILETKLLQLEGPKESMPIEVNSEPEESIFSKEISNPSSEDFQHD